MMMGFNSTTLGILHEVLIPHPLMHRNHFANKLFADSVVGVGVVAGLYHSSKGEARRFFRWSDHVMIATSALVKSLLYNKLWRIRQALIKNKALQLLYNDWMN